jgi:hypothetical protein
MLGERPVAVIDAHQPTVVMTTPARAFDHAPPQWAGLAIMLGYTLIFGTIGIVVTRRRDVS